MTTLGVVFTVLALAALAVLVLLIIGTWSTPPVTRRTKPRDASGDASPALWMSVMGAVGSGDGHHHHGGHSHGHSGDHGGFGGGFDGGGAGHGGGGHG